MIGVEWRRIWATIRATDDRTGEEVKRGVTFLSRIPMWEFRGEHWKPVNGKRVIAGHNYGLWDWADVIKAVERKTFPEGYMTPIHDMGTYTDEGDEDYEKGDSRAPGYSAFSFFEDHKRSENPNPYFREEFVPWIIEHWR